MSSHSATAQPEEARSSPGTLSRLLDPAFGFLIWAIHFLSIYIATAVACVLGLSDASTSLGVTPRATLVVLTVAAVVLVASHAVRRYRQQHALPEQAFRLAVTIGCDAIAAAAISWQLFAILLVPACV
jgi:Mn2+/Fe2+ NRAMP family transporter